MTLVPYFAAHAGLSRHLAALGDAVARDDGTDKLNFRACLHGSPFPGVLEKVPLYLSLSNCARATARAMNWMDQIFPYVNMTV
jgi:hypothetical protein